MNKHQISILLIFSMIISFTGLGAQSLSAVNDNVRVKEDTPQLIDVLKNDKVSNKQNLEITIIQNHQKKLILLKTIIKKI